MASSATLRVFRWTSDPAEGLVFRDACRVGMCGSCAMVVNGRERWARRTRLQSLGSGPVSVRPLYHFPLLRDLVVDMTPFAAKLRDIDAALTPRGNSLVSGLSAERREMDLAIECIGCGICVSAARWSGTTSASPDRRPSTGC